MQNKLKLYLIYIASSSSSYFRNFRSVIRFAHMIRADPNCTVNQTEVRVRKTTGRGMYFLCCVYKKNVDNKNNCISFPALSITRCVCVCVCCSIERVHARFLQPPKNKSTNLYVFVLANKTKQIKKTPPHIGYKTNCTTNDTNIIIITHTHTYVLLKRLGVGVVHKKKQNTQIVKQAGECISNVAIYTYIICVHNMNSK